MSIEIKSDSGNRKILIAGYPKSGNTWLGYMLSYILGAKYTDLEEPNENVTKHKGILCLIDGSMPQRAEYSEVCKTHERYYFRQTESNYKLESFDKVILIVRDPRDVAVSYYFFRYSNIPATTGQDKRLSNRSALMRKILWKRVVILTARNWANHTSSWRAFEGTSMIRYEDLKNDCTTTMQRVCAILGIESNTTLIEDAIRQFSFERLSGGRKPGEEYQASFFRKGIIGDHKHYFDSLDSHIMRRYAGVEMASLGYV